jgi:hypothetical protein
MPNLGEQFNNTYFEGDDNVVPYEDNQSYGEIHGTPRSKNPQGLLFHPDTATQTRNDPLYSRKARLIDLSNITGATKVQGTGQGIASRASGKISDNPPKMAYAISTTNLSKPMLENKPVAIEAMRSTRKAGSFSPAEHKISVNLQDINDNNFSYDDLGATFTHEWGHKEDQDNLTAHGARTTMYKGRMVGYRGIETARSTTKGNTVTSPVMEGVADGYKDRFGTITDLDSGEEVSERYLNPIENDERHLDFTGQGSASEGYGVNFKGWRDKHEQALYAATRIHVAMHGRAGIESLPDIDALADKHLSSLKQEVESKTGKNAEKNAKFATTARHLYLGQMMENHPHVREGLKQLGLDDVGEYSRAVHAHYTAPLPSKEQSTIPGFEKLAPTAPPLPKNIKVNRTDSVGVAQNEKKAQAKDSGPGIVRNKNGTLSIRLF